MAAAVALPGTDAGLSILPWLFREPKRVAVLAPCYSGHAAAWTAAGHSVSEIGSLDRAGNAAILVAVNPNNPDGRFIAMPSSRRRCLPLKRRDGLLIVDEAFADADESHSLLPHVARLDYTLVLRSVGKFFGAGGVRLGFAITSHPVAGGSGQRLGHGPFPRRRLRSAQAALADDGMGRDAADEAAAKPRTQLDAVLTEAGLPCRLAGPRCSGSRSIP